MFHLNSISITFDWFFRFSFCFWICTEPSKLWLSLIIIFFYNLFRNAQRRFLFSKYVLRVTIRNHVPMNIRTNNKRVNDFRTKKYQLDVDLLINAFVNLALRFCWAIIVANADFANSRFSVYPNTYEHLRYICPYWNTIYGVLTIASNPEWRNSRSMVISLPLWLCYLLISLNTRRETCTLHCYTYVWYIVKTFNSRIFVTKLYCEWNKLFTERTIRSF